MNDDLTFGQWLKARMQALDLTIPVLADQIGRSHGPLFKWRNGTHHPVGKVQESLAAALGVPVSEIRMRVFKERRALHAAKSATPVSA